MTINTDGAGQFSASLAGLMDLSWTTTVNVAYQDSGGNWSMVDITPQNGVVISLHDDSMSGYTQPGTTITTTVNHLGAISTQTATADPIDGWWWVGFPEIDAGDQVTADVGSGMISATASPLSGLIDPVTDTISGEAPPNSQVNVLYSTSLRLAGWVISQVAPTNAGGDFNTDYSAIGLDNYNWAGLYYHTTSQVDTNIWFPPYQAYAELP
jgi:hypothetical protein